MPINLLENWPLLLDDWPYGVLANWLYQCKKNKKWISCGYYKSVLRPRWVFSVIARVLAVADISLPDVWKLCSNFLLRIKTKRFERQLVFPQNDAFRYQWSLRWWTRNETSNGQLQTTKVFRPTLMGVAIVVGYMPANSFTLKGPSNPTTPVDCHLYCCFYTCQVGNTSSLLAGGEIWREQLGLVAAATCGFEGSAEIMCADTQCTDTMLWRSYLLIFFSISARQQLATGRRPPSLRQQ